MFLTHSKITYSLVMLWKKYRLGHDLVRLVDSSAPDSREPTSGLRRELRQTDRESDVAKAEGPRDDDRRMA